MSTVVYRRNLGPVERLEPGEYTTETIYGRAVLCCASCGGLHEIAEPHRIDPTGFVVPALKCPTVTCTEYRYVRLEAWGEPWV